MDASPMGMQGSFQNTPNRSRMHNRYGWSKLLGCDPQRPRQYLNHFLIQRVSAGELCFERALIVGFLVDATIVSPVDSNTSGDPPKVSNMVDWKGF